jgi:hypothetical protein
MPDAPQLPMAAELSDFGGVAHSINRETLRTP